MESRVALAFKGTYHPVSDRLLNAKILIHWFPFAHLFTSRLTLFRCGTIGREVVSNTRGQHFQFSHQQRTYL